MNIDARKLSPEQQELLRQKSIRLRKRGKTFREIGQLLDVHPDTVGRWYKRYETGGAAAIAVQKRGPKNKPRRLSEQQEQQVIEAVRDQMPDQYKLGFALWTRRAIAQLIKQLWGIDIPVRTMGDYLKRWGFTPQKPLKKAWEQNPSRVDAWLKEEYPQIKARAEAENAQIFWGDETGIKNNTQHGRSYAPVGQTPVQPLPAKRVSLNMISAITNQGTVRFMLYESTMTAKVLKKFLRALIESTPGKVFLILDNLRVHHAKVVKRWLERKAVKRYLEVFFLPAYSPELNPDEYLNCDLKGMVHSGPAPRTVDELKNRTRSCMRTLQRRPERVKKYFNSEHIAYAA
ncbi:IS630 family transposase [Nitrincola sp. MINF-07-Sa-05]|uniref:IS630 family transposase n=1 Tax=Nitrincola salilacus TaxID=3400273 RepID=UPI0039181868